MDFELSKEISEKIVALNEVAIGQLVAASGLTVNTNEDLQLVSDKRRELKALLNQRETDRKNLKKPFKALADAVDEMFRVDTDKIEQAIDALNDLAVDYQKKVDDIRKIKQAKLEAEARRERQRIEAEAAKTLKIAKEKAEELARQEAAARAEGDLAKASKLAAKAEALSEKAEDKADNLDSLARAMAPAQPKTEAPKAAGLTFREEYYFRIVDADKIPREYLLIDDKGLASRAKASRGKAIVPGVEFYSKKIPVQTRAR